MPTLPPWMIAALLGGGAMYARRREQAAQQLATGPWNQAVPLSPADRVRLALLREQAARELAAGARWAALEGALGGALAAQLLPGTASRLLPIKTATWRATLRTYGVPA